MHAIAYRTLCTARRPITRRACRIIGGVRYPIPRRTFHNSTAYLRAAEESAPTENEGESIAAEVQEGNSEAVETVDTENVGAASSSKSKEKVKTLTVTPQRGRTARHGAGRTRPNRSRQPEGLPPVVLPQWFWENNVKCIGEPEQGGSLAVFGTGQLNESNGQPISRDTEEQSNKDASSSVEEGAFGDEFARQILNVVQCDLNSTADAKYTLHVDVYQEIFATIRSGLALRPPKSVSSPVIRPVPLLQCPKDGGTYFLDSVVETIASKLGADLVRLDAQDLAQIVGPYADENLAWQTANTSLLSYEAHRIAGRLEEYDKDTTPAQDDTEGMEEEEEGMEAGKNGKPTAYASAFSILPGNYSKTLTSLFGNMKNPSQSKVGAGPSLDIFAPQSIFSSRGNIPPPPPSSDADQWRSLKISAAIDAIIASADMKRTSTADSAKSEAETLVIRDIIVQIKDYKELSATADGAELLSKLRASVNRKWQEGRNIICVGTTSSEQGEPALSRPEIQHLQADVTGGERRTILVPPDRREEQDTVFESDDKVRIRNINIRHVEEMIKKMADGTPSFSMEVDVEKDLDSAAAYAVGLEDAVWTYPRIYRLATTILGLEPCLSAVDGTVFGKALKLLASSDEAKFAWGAAELKSEDAEVETMVADIAKVGSSAKKQFSDKIKQIRKNCNSHEKKLLGGVVMPSDIKTTFGDIRAPEATIEALKTLTSLSLIRPEAFSYGVLATDKIPGLLLYGPPGTGKTLLAKAVAKESGATVLEVSGADVNDMFVGEAEKNVKAVFSLAKKLSPCIVFIDEADAIFAARGDMKQRSSHRELINQFLREWDGMNDMSAFIMIATNRPFDLDEAVLRRLPRRLLVDLPVEKDREAILKIHLKDEVLDESVSLSKIAKDTPFYSGSDLKNVSVAAALACIREENAAAAKHTGDGPYKFPEKRILRKAHFTKALEEISASISEDMSTLTAIRKFDEKYGDRKGRRKKGAALGFGGTQTVEKDSDAARVRNLEV